MDRRIRGGIVALALGVALGAAEAAPAPAGGPKIGVIDIPRAVQAYKKRDVLQKDIEANVKKIQLQVEALKGQIKDLEDKLASDLAQKDQEMRDKLEIDLAKLRPDLEVEIRHRNAVNNRETAKAMRLLFDDIKRVVDEVAQQENCDLVFQILPPNPEGKGDVMEEIIRRPLLYFKKDAVVDVTDRVVAALNAAYDKQPRK